MDAHPVLVRVAEAMERHKLEAVLIGNAAAVLQGRDADGLQVDFMDYIHGIRSFQELRSRSAEIRLVARESLSRHWLILSGARRPPGGRRT